MQRRNSILAILAAVFLLFGNIGFDVFAHICNKDGVEVSYFVKDDSICDAHGHKSVHDHATVEEDICDEHAEGNCCTTTSNHFQIKVDFASKISIQPVLIASVAVQPVWADQVPYVEQVIRRASGTDPPPKSGAEICIEIQQWLI